MVKSPNKYICRERYGDDVAAFDNRRRDWGKGPQERLRIDSKSHFKWITKRKLTRVNLSFNLTCSQISAANSSQGQPNC